MSTGWKAFPGGQQPDHNIGHHLVIYTWTFTSFATIVVAIRLFAVCHVLKRVSAADYTMVVALLFIIIGNVLVSEGCRWGLGRHIYYLSPEQIANVVKYSYLMTPPTIFGVALGRASFCLFLLKSIGTERPVRIILWFTLTLQGLVCLSQIILQYAVCGTHISAVWDPTVHAKCVPYGIIIDYLYFQSAFNAFTDLFLTVFPAVILKDLNIPLKKKIIALILLCISVFAFVASIAKCIMVQEMRKIDGTWSVARLDFWILGEAYIIIIVASIPQMNCLLKWRRESLSRDGRGNVVSSWPKDRKQSWGLSSEVLKDNRG